MTSDQDKERKAPKRDHGPQGTHVFSRGEVDRLIDQVNAAEAPTRGAYLKGLSEGIRDQTFALHGDRVVLGRGDACDIRLGDASVSSEHARLIHEADGWRVANLLSTNGTFVNNVKVSNGVLHHGDRLRLGRVEFVLHDPGKARRSDATAAWVRWLPIAGAVAVVAIMLWVLLR